MSEDSLEAILEFRRKIESLPWRALDEIARADDRESRFIVRVDSVRAAVEENGFWQEEFEWRISTPGAWRIERAADGYAVKTTAHGEFSATFGTFPEAYEAKSVLFSLQVCLFYAIGWATWPAKPLRRPENIREQYLRELAKTARAEASPPGSIARVPADWSKTGFAYRVVVERGSLRMTADAVDAARAAEFAGVYDRLQKDLLEMLEWQPL